MSVLHDGEGARRGDPSVDPSREKPDAWSQQPVERKRMLALGRSSAVHLRVVCGDEGRDLGGGDGDAVDHKAHRPSIAEPCVERMTGPLGVRLTHRKTGEDVADLSGGAPGAARSAVV